MRPSLLYLLLALSLLGIKLTYDHGQRQVGVVNERLRVTDSTVSVLQKRTKAVDTVYRRDTIRLTRRVQSWDTVTRTVAALPDTVRVPVEVVRWVVREADSTITACRSVVMTCEQRVAARDSLIGTLQARGRILEQQRPSRLRPWLERAAWAGLVVLVAK